jgi:3-mercaptopyruvate sulfurtransferase SseA
MMRIRSQLYYSLCCDQDMTLQKQLEYTHREFLVDMQWVEDQPNDPKASIAEVHNDRMTNYEFGHIPGSIRKIIGRTKKSVKLNS